MSPRAYKRGKARSDGGKRTAGGKQREGGLRKRELHWSHQGGHGPGQAGKAAPDSRKGRKPGFPQSPDSTAAS